MPQNREQNASVLEFVTSWQQKDLEEPVDDLIILAFNKPAVHKLHNMHMWFKVEFYKW